MSIRSKTRLQKSVSLTQNELDILNEMRSKQNTDVAFATSIGIDRVTLLRIINQGSGSEKNIKKIRRKLSSVAA